MAANAFAGFLQGDDRDIGTHAILVPFGILQIFRVLDRSAAGIEQETPRWDSDGAARADGTYGCSHARRGAGLHRRHSGRSHHSRSASRPGHKIHVPDALSQRLRSWLTSGLALQPGSEMFADNWISLHRSSRRESRPGFKVLPEMHQVPGEGVGVLKEKAIGIIPGLFHLGLGEAI